MVAETTLHRKNNCKLVIKRRNKILMKNHTPTLRTKYHNSKIKFPINKHTFFFLIHLPYHYIFLPRKENLNENHLKISTLKNVVACFKTKQKVSSCRNDKEMESIKLKKSSHERKIRKRDMNEYCPYISIVLRFSFYFSAKKGITLKFVCVSPYSRSQQVFYFRYCPKI